jgi:hypothetical protein
LVVGANALGLRVGKPSQDAMLEQCMDKNGDACRGCWRKKSMINIVGWKLKISHIEAKLLLNS